MTLSLMSRNLEQLQNKNKKNKKIYQFTWLKKGVTNAVKLYYIHHLLAFNIWSW